MKKPLIIGISLIVWLLGPVSQLMAEHNSVDSLRGHTPLEDVSKSPIKKQWVTDDVLLERDYVQQPPLIPHSIKGYKINLKFNKCLTCHSWANYREARATKISQTHFADRENNVLANIAPRRYFCNQCHVPQALTKPLVENTFEPVRAIKAQQ